MSRQRLKLNARYGMATTIKSFRPHLLDPRRTSVLVIPGHPELTRYNIIWQCGKTPSSKPRLLRQLPGGVELCRTCQLVRDRIEFYEAQEKIMQDSWAMQGPVPF